MKNLLSLGLFFYSLSVYSQSVSSRWCSQVKKYYTEVQENEENSLSEILDQDPQVIIFGEMHTDFRSHDIFMKMVGELKELDSDFSCLFLEMPQELDQGAMDDWLNRKISYETMASRWCDPVKDSIKESCKKRASLFYTPLFKTKLEKARDLGLQVYYMDATHDTYFVPGDWRITMPKWLYTVGMLERNMIMARNIAEKLGRKQCKKAFAIVGSAHNTEKTTKDIPIRGITGDLKVLGHHGISINFFATKPDPRVNNYHNYSPFYMPEKECGLSLPTDKIYRLPYSSTKVKFSPEALDEEKWVYQAVPSLQERPFGTFEYIYLHDCPECSQKPVVGESILDPYGFDSNSHR